MVSGASCKRLGIALGSPGRLDHHLDKGIHGGLAFGLGRLDHDGFLDDHREIDRGRVIAAVDQEFGDVDGMHAMCQLPGCREDAFVHAGHVVGQIVVGLQPFLDVVGIEHRLFRDLDQPLAAQHDDIGVGLDHYAEVAEKIGGTADGLWIGGLQRKCLPVVHDNPRLRQEGDQRLLDPHRPGAGTAAAVGRAEGLVQIDVNHVKADVARLDLTHDGVQIGAVIVHQGIVGMGNIADLLDMRIEQPQGIGAGHHYCRHLVGHGLFEQLDIHVAIGSGRHGDDLVTGHGRRGGIGAVG